jgi:small nuclear ribonucleoprotein (snRNP)-like protein
MSKTVLLKLVSGEEIIGKLEDANDSDALILEDVRELMIQQTGQGQIGIALVPWMAGAPDNSVKVFRTHIVGSLVSDVPKQLEDAYLQQTSGIQFAGATQGIGLAGV